MDQVHVIRHKVINEEQSIRQVARDMRVSRNTVRRYLKRSEPVRVEKGPRRCPVLDRVGCRIDALLEEWKERADKKQRITGSRLHRQLVEEGYQVGITTVRAYLAEKRRQDAEVFIPLPHRPGEEAQVDFFEVTVEERGVRRKVWKFLMRWMYSGRDFVWLYDRCDQISFLDGHVRAFAYFGAVPRRCIYDNLGSAVRRVVYPRRELTDRFGALVSHYVFEPCFTRVGEAHDKGGVESRGKGIRLQHLTPIPQGRSLSEIAQVLLGDVEKAASCKKDAEGRSVIEKFEEDRSCSLPIPSEPFDPSRSVVVSISNKSLARIEGAWYSLPSHWARLQATAYIGVDQVRIVCRGQTRTYPRQPFGGRYICYRDYLPELAKKPQAVRQVAPELMSELGEPFQSLWRLLEETHGGHEAGRVMAKILKAVAEHGLEGVREAVRQALTANRVELLGLGRLMPKPETNPVPDALAGLVVEQAHAADYDFLLGGGRYE